MASQVIVEAVGEFEVFQTPVGSNKILFGRLRHEAVENDVGTQAGNVLRQKGDVFVQAEELHKVGMFGHLTGQGGVFDKLQLMQFERGNGPARKFGCRSQHLLATFAGQSKDEVNADGDAARGQCVHALARAGHIMSAIDQSERLVTQRFHTKFDEQESSLG